MTPRSSPPSPPPSPPSGGSRPCSAQSSSSPPVPSWRSSAASWSRASSPHRTLPNRRSVCRPRPRHPPSLDPMGTAWVTGTAGGGTWVDPPEVTFEDGVDPVSSISLAERADHDERIRASAGRSRTPTTRMSTPTRKGTFRRSPSARGPTASRTRPAAGRAPTSSSTRAGAAPPPSVTPASSSAAVPTRVSAPSSSSTTAPGSGPSSGRSSPASCRRSRPSSSRSERPCQDEARPARGGPIFMSAAAAVPHSTVGHATTRHRHGKKSGRRGQGRVRVAGSRRGR